MALDSCSYSPHKSTMFRVPVACFLFIQWLLTANGAIYEIKVTTADEYLAGTDARVFIDIIGQNGLSSGSIELETKGVNDLEPGQTDTYYRHAVFIKPITAIKLHRDNGFLYPGWKPSNVTIQVNGGKSLYTFYYNKFLPAHTWVLSYEEDECRAGISKCQHFCINTNNGYDCGCKKGYESVGKYRCKDIDECSTGKHSCDLGISTCVNVLGAYNCTCANGAGYEQTSHSSCQDVDECTTGEHKCDLLTSVCVNKPGTYNCSCRTGYEQVTQNICRGKECNGSEPLGMENGHIKDESITASSYYTQYPPWSSRLGLGTGKSWYALPNDPSPWIQVDLGKPTWLRGVATQGKRYTMFVKTFKLVNSLDAVTWSTYSEDSQADKIFGANTDAYSVARIDLTKPVYTRFVRIYPQTWNDAVALKLELYGCRPV